MDKYDLEIERLSQVSADELDRAWDSDDDVTANSPLFQFCSRTGRASGNRADSCGCLVQVCWFSWKFTEIPALTEAIRADRRIPWDVTYQGAWDGLTRRERIAILTHFADWQRALDATIRAGKPWHNDFIPRRDNEHRADTGAGHGLPASTDGIPVGAGRL